MDNLLFGFHSVDFKGFWLLIFNLLINQKFEVILEFHWGLA